MPIKNKYLQFAIKISPEYTEDEKQAISQEIIDKILDRTEGGRGVKNGALYSFPKYSSLYKNSLDYKNAGKSGTVDLTLSGDMLTMLRYLPSISKKNEIVIGYEEKDDVAGRVEGNVRGTYGASRGNNKKARNFLGITQKELNAVLSKFPLDNDKLREKNTDNVLESDEAARRLADQIELDDGE